MTSQLFHGAVHRMALLGLLASTACATTMPIQTASTVPKGAVRVSGQITTGVYCGFSDVDKCAVGGSTPELRLAGRVGLHDRVDLGLSAQMAYTYDAGGPEWGALLDGKIELWRSEIAPGRKQVVSAGLGFAGSLIDDSRQDFELGLLVPVKYGYQFESIELFAGGHLLERFAFGVLSGNKPATVPVAGFTLGLMTRKRAKLGFALGYEAPLRFFDRGAFTVGVGFLFDVGGNPDRDTSATVPPPAPVIVFPEAG